MEYHYSSFNRPALEAYPPFGYLRCEASTEHPHGVLVYKTKLVQAAMNQYELYPVSDNAYAYPVGAVVWYEGIDKCRVTEHVGRGRYMLELVDDASLTHEYVSPKSLEMYTDLTPTYPVKNDGFGNWCPDCGLPRGICDCENAPMTHTAVLAHNNGALFDGHPQDFIGYDDDTGIGETVSETLERAEACIALVEQALKAQVTYGDIFSKYVERQLADLRTILHTL